LIRIKRQPAFPAMVSVAGWTPVWDSGSTAKLETL
jgi:hypothetical protein